MGLAPPSRGPRFAAACRYFMPGGESVPVIQMYAAPIPEGQSQHEAGRALLRRAMEEAGLPAGLPLERAPGGKPFLPGAPEFHFNLSHSGGWAVCAVGNAPLGVDLQRERPLRQSVFRRFAPAERAMLEALPERERQGAFFDLWVLKESYLKATGAGLPGGLASACFTLNPVTLSDPDYRAALESFPERGYHLAVCVRGKEPPEVRWPAP